MILDYIFINSSNLNLSITASILATIIMSIFLILSKKIKRLIIYNYTNFSIDGIWVSEFSFNNYKAFEFIKIKINGEKISIKCQSYKINKDRFQCVLTQGEGVYRAGYIFCPYVYVGNKNNNQVGVYVLRQYSMSREHALVGFFLQTHTEKCQTGFYQDHFTFVPLHLGQSLPITKRLLINLKFIFNKKIFTSKENLINFLSIMDVKNSIKENRKAYTEWDELIKKEKNKI